MCTAVPPAKSNALSLLAIQPPRLPVPVKPSKENTQCATGKYTTVTQIATNSVHDQNFALSAMAPEISAGVITANMSWNMTKDSVVIWSGFAPATCPIVLFSKALCRPPTSLPNASLPNASL